MKRMIRAILVSVLACVIMPVISGCGKKDSVAQSSGSNQAIESGQSTAKGDVFGLLAFEILLDSEEAAAMKAQIQPTAAIGLADLEERIAASTDPDEIALMQEAYDYLLNLKPEDLFVDYPDGSSAMILPAANMQIKVGNTIVATDGNGLFPLTELDGKGSDATLYDGDVRLMSFAINTDRSLSINGAPIETRITIPFYQYVQQNM